MEQNREVDMSMNRMMVVFLGVLFCLAGCVFHPDIDDGNRPNCDSDTDCDPYGDCVCLGGVCVPSEAGGECVIEGGCDQACDNPPPDVCNGDVLKTHSSTGECIDSSCRYASETIECPAGCEDGACLDPCAGVDCDPGEECIEGACMCGGTGQDCGPDSTCCGTECVDTDVDANHCRECNRACDNPFDPLCDGNVLITFGRPGECTDGLCTYPEIREACPFFCVNGACAGQTCGEDCESPMTCCAGQCVDTTSDTGNCGTCGKACNDPPEPRCNGPQQLAIYDTEGNCSNGGCEYEWYPVSCEFGCAEAACLPDPCAMIECDDDAQCIGGECLCGSEDLLTLCSGETVCCQGACVDTYMDMSNCGGCGLVCEAGVNHVYDAWCIDGICYLWCDPDSGDCDENPFNGCEAYTWNDTSNCGECGFDCTQLPAVEIADCGDGVCIVASCAEMFANCDGEPWNGCETDLMNDRYRCGDCYTPIRQCD